MAKVTFKGGTGINVAADNTNNIVTVSTNGTIPSPSAPLAPNMGGLGRTDMANQIDGLAGATSASSTNRVATMNDLNAVDNSIPSTTTPLPVPPLVTVSGV